MRPGTNRHPVATRRRVGQPLLIGWDHENSCGAKSEHLQSTKPPQSS
jgi:hypothetical protein